MCATLSVIIRASSREAFVCGWRGSVTMHMCLLGSSKSSGTSNTSPRSAAGAAMARSKRKPAKRMARKVAKGAEKAVMQMDRMLRQF